MIACEVCGQAAIHAATCPGVPMFCTLCEKDVGSVWPIIPNGPLPRVVHRPDGTHVFQWTEGETTP